MKKNMVLTIALTWWVIWAGLYLIKIARSLIRSAPLLWKDFTSSLMLSVTVVTIMFVFDRIRRRTALDD